MLRSVILLCLVIGIFPSCKKEADYGYDYGQGTGHCRIARAGNYSNNTDSLTVYESTYSYDDSNRVSQIVYHQPMGTLITDITYSGRSIVAHHRDTAGAETYIDSMVLNKRGQMEARGAIYPGGIFRFWSRMQYNAAAELIRIDYYYGPTGGIPYATETYRWENGDLVEAYNGYGTYHYEYTSIPAQFYPSDQSGTIPTLGRPLFKTKHLRKADYTYDAEGKVTRIQLPMGSSTPNGYRKLEYECN